jgi:hypothetical protein
MAILHMPCTLQRDPPRPDRVRALHQALLDKHQPKGPTEQHLVDQLTTLIWRPQRVLQAGKYAYVQARICSSKRVCVPGHARIGYCGSTVLRWSGLGWAALLRSAAVLLDFYCVLGSFQLGLACGAGVARDFSGFWTE